MRSQIVQIGNSQGIRIPKVLLEESGIRGEIELELCSDGILIRNIQKPRSDWEARFQQHIDQDDDHALNTGSSTEFEVYEWQW